MLQCGLGYSALLFRQPMHKPCTQDMNQPNTSPINPEEKGDLDRYPLLANLSSLTCDLQPGDILYIPKNGFTMLKP
jgi:hypothetical protein